MLKEFKNRDKEIYLFRMGYIGGVRHTLQETADACGMNSRQRVQQICNEIYFALRKLEKELLAEQKK